MFLRTTTGTLRAHSITVGCGMISRLHVKWTPRTWQATHTWQPGFRSSKYRSRPTHSWRIVANSETTLAHCVSFSDCGISETARITCFPENCSDHLWYSAHLASCAQGRRTTSRKSRAFNQSIENFSLSSVQEVWLDVGRCTGLIVGSLQKSLHSSARKGTAA
jgi:hypothetical protein